MPSRPLLLLLSLFVTTLSGCGGAFDVNSASIEICEKAEERLAIMKTIKDRQSYLEGTRKLIVLCEKEQETNTRMVRALMKMRGEGIEPDVSQFDSYEARYAKTLSECKKQIVRIESAVRLTDDDEELRKAYREAGKAGVQNTNRNPFR